jgi:hypothetical protein
MFLGLHGNENDIEWMARLTDFLNAIENLQPTGQTETDVMAEKCSLLSTAALAAPRGNIREKVMDRYVQLLKVSNPQPEMLPAWYYEVHSFIDLMKSTDNDQESALLSFERSGDPLLSLVSALYHLEGRGAASPSASIFVPALHHFSRD